jgi:hypothetical protein
MPKPPKYYNIKYYLQIAIHIYLLETTFAKLRLP